MLSYKLPSYACKSNLLRSEGIMTAGMTTESKPLHAIEAQLAAMIAVDDPKPAQLYDQLVAAPCHCMRKHRPHPSSQERPPHLMRRRVCLHKAIVLHCPGAVPAALVHLVDSL